MSYHIKVLNLQKNIIALYFDTYFQPRITIPRSVQNYSFLRIPESVKTDNI